MKTKPAILHAVILMPFLISPFSAAGQGTIYVSNAEQTSTTGIAGGSDSWIAQTFVTGTNADAFMLNSVQLRMAGASGTPVGFDVFLYSGFGTGSLVNLGRLFGPDPVSEGIFTYTTDGLMLMPSHGYSVVVTAATPIAQGAFSWSATSSLTDRTPEGWIISPAHSFSTDGIDWDLSRQYVLQMAVNATAIPEPSSLAVLCFGGLCLAACLLRRGSSRPTQ